MNLTHFILKRKITSEKNIELIISVHIPTLQMKYGLNIMKKFLSHVNFKIKHLGHVKSFFAFFKVKQLVFDVNLKGKLNVHPKDIKQACHSRLCT